MKPSKQQLPTFNLNELQDGDIVVYEDRDREIKINSKVHTNGRMNPNGKLHESVNMKEFTHILVNEIGTKFKLFIVKSKDLDYNLYI